MKATLIRTGDMLTRVKQFTTDHPLLPANATATAQIAVLDASIAALSANGTGQETGRGLVAGAVDDRLRLQGELRKELSGIARIARELDEEAYPGAAAQFRCSRIRTYTGLLNRAHAFIEAIGPMKAVFVDHGMPADFDESLAGLVAALEAAGNRKFGGLHEQMNGTAGLDLAAKKGVKAVRVLDAIMRQKLKSNPALLAVWIQAQKIERPPKKAKAPAPQLAVNGAKAAPALKNASNGPVEEQPTAVEPRVNGTNGGVLVA
jgi:hypothetical protein